MGLDAKCDVTVKNDVGECRRRKALECWMMMLFRDC